MAEDMTKKLGSGVVVLIATEEGKASIVVAVTKDLTAKINAVDLVNIAFWTHHADADNFLSTVFDNFQHEKIMPVDGVRVEWGRAHHAFNRFRVVSSRGTNRVITHVSIPASDFSAYLYHDSPYPM